MPLLMVVISPSRVLVPIVSAASLGFLALLGAIGARAGGANVLRATARVTFWGGVGDGSHRRYWEVLRNSYLTRAFVQILFSRPLLALKRTFYTSPRMSAFGVKRTC